MKETAKIHLDLLKQKEKNLEKTISELEKKRSKILEQYENAVKSLERVKNQIANFGVRRPRSSNPATDRNSNPVEMSISKYSKNFAESSNFQNTEKLDFSEFFK